MRLRAKTIEKRERILNYQLKRSEMLWSMMTFEANLITVRVNWLISGQSFLFAAFFIGIAQTKDESFVPLELIISIPFILTMSLLALYPLP